MSFALKFHFLHFPIDSDFTSCLHMFDFMCSYLPPGLGGFAMISVSTVEPCP